MNSTTATNRDTESAVSVLAKIERHRAQQAFIERGLASLEAAKMTGEYVSSERGYERT